jgi:xylulokinase
MNQPPPTTTKTNDNNILLLLGLDISTTSLKAHLYQLVNSHTISLIQSSTINYDNDLPQYQTKGGVIRQDNKVHVPSLMFFEALDLVLSKLSPELLSKCVAIGGGAQQHTSVLWNQHATSAFEKLKQPTTNTKSKSLIDILSNSFTTPTSASWQDSSTTEIILALQKNVPQTQIITGSKPTARFTGPQIAHLSPNVFLQCCRVHLCSSAITAVLTGELDHHQPDISDACGMNVLDLRTKQWSSTLIDGLIKSSSPSSGIQSLPFEQSRNHFVEKILGPPPRFLLQVEEDSGVQVLPIASYFCQRYGFPPTTKVTSLTGDNIALAYGLGLQENSIYLSFGTSDTMVFILPVNDTSIQENDSLAENNTNYHVFLLPGGKLKLVLLCWTNGSLSRQVVCNRSCNGNWSLFDKQGEEQLSLFNLDEPIITRIICATSETIPEIHHHNIEVYSQGTNITIGPIQTNNTNPIKLDVRSILETRIAQMYNHYKKLSTKLIQQQQQQQPSRIVVCGGGAQCNSLIQMISQVFCNVPVYVSKHDVEAVAIGGAIRAAKFGLGLDVLSPLQQEEEEEEKNAPIRCEATPQRIEYNKKLCLAVESSEIALKKYDDDDVS